jgi:hypothetical protein
MKKEIIIPMLQSLKEGKISEEEIYNLLMEEQANVKRCGCGKAKNFTFNSSIWTEQ